LALRCPRRGAELVSGAAAAGAGADGPSGHPEPALPRLRDGSGIRAVRLGGAERVARPYTYGIPSQGAPGAKAEPRLGHCPRFSPLLVAAAVSPLPCRPHHGHRTSPDPRNSGCRSHAAGAIGQAASEPGSSLGLEEAAAAPGTAGAAVSLRVRSGRSLLRRVYSSG
jgi:hypothetical protein